MVRYPIKKNLTLGTKAGTIKLLAPKREYHLTPGEAHKMGMVLFHLARETRD